MMTESRTVATLCRMCDDRCGIFVRVENGVVTEITGNPEHPANRGRLCAKARGAVDLVNHPDRLRTPLKRTAGGWREIPLDQALDEIAARVREITDRHGARSLAVWKGEAVGFQQQEDLARRFIHALGSPNYFSNDTLCYVARYIGYRTVTGGWPVCDAENARALVVWGANPPHTHPTLFWHMREARRRGARLIVVDPRLSTLAEQADIHAQLRPGTDGALAWGLVRELIHGGLYDEDYVDRRTKGFAEIERYAEAFTPDLVARETGLPAALVPEIAREMAHAAPRLATYMGVGVEHHENAVNTIRSVLLLDALLGTFGREGGSLFPPAAPLRDLTLYDELPLDHLGPVGADRFPVLYEARRECHTAVAMDAILEDEPYPLRALILTAANPLLTNPNSTKVRQAFEALDLLVVRDLFMTDTAAVADYVLPAAGFLERTELRVHPKPGTITLTPKVVDDPDLQGEYDFWRALAHRLGAAEYFPWEDETELNRWLLQPTAPDWEDLVGHPEGVPYAAPGASEPSETGDFPTPSGRIELTSEHLESLGYERLPVYRPAAAEEPRDPAYPFLLITGARKLRYVHSRYQNIPKFRRVEGGPEVEIHPEDARALGVEGGEPVRVVSPVGSVVLAARIMAPGEIRQGELQITHGWSEANANLVTPDDRLDPISGFPSLKSVAVRVEKLPGDGPPV